MNILDPRFTYHGERSHADSQPFRDRQRARMAAAAAAAAADKAHADDAEKERAQKVRTITPPKRKVRA